MRDVLWLAVPAISLSFAAYFQAYFGNELTMVLLLILLLLGLGVGVAGCVRLALRFGQILRFPGAGATQFVLMLVFIIVWICALVLLVVNVYVMNGGRI